MTKKNKERAKKAEREFPVSFYNWGKNVEEGGSAESRKNKIGLSLGEFKEYLRAWKKKHLEPEGD